MVDYFLFSGLVATTVLLVVQHAEHAKMAAYYRGRDAHYVSTLKRLKVRCQRALTSRDPEVALEITLDEITDELTNHNH